MLQNDPLVVKFRFDTAENEISLAEMDFADCDELVMNTTVSANVGQFHRR